MRSSAASLSSDASPRGALWVFGYGSLIWNPGFAYALRRKARLSGWSRRLCIHSHVYRGTPERPGLVLGLARGGSCAGVAFLVEARSREATIRYLREREQVTSVYVERFAPVVLDDGVRVQALTYVADPLHAQFAGRLTRSEMLAIVRAATGQAGDNAAYVTHVHDHLRAIGARDTDLEWLTLQLRADAARAGRA